MVNDLLAGIAAANNGLAAVLCPGQSRQGQGREDGDDRDDDQKLDQGKSLTWRPFQDSLRIYRKF